MRTHLSLLSSALLSTVLLACGELPGPVTSVEQVTRAEGANPALELEGHARSGARPESAMEPAPEAPPRQAQVPLDPAGAQEAAGEAPFRGAPPEGEPPSEPGEEEPPANEEPPADEEPAQREVTCQEPGAEGLFGCYSSEECCEGFCSYCGTSYMPGQCELPREVGESCLDDAWCQSEICVDGACQAESCQGSGQACWSSSECCGAQFCAEAGPYVPGSCAALLSDGEACAYHDWCASGVCTDGICTSPSCTDNGAECYHAEDCCTGLCTWDAQNPYIPGACFSPQPEGAACQEPSWCESGLCHEGVCAAPDCQATEAFCWSDGECCEGFCTYTGESAYTPGLCQPLQPIDAPCLSDAWCESGVCSDGLCVPAGCQPLAANCHAGSECCSGLCTYSGSGEACGSCIAPQPEGTPCVADMWCASKSCVDGHCQP